MKLKLDENLPQSLAEALDDLGHDVDTVRDEGLVRRDDKTVWRAAQDTGRFFITQDMDFSNVNDFRPGSHPGIMVVRLRTPGRLALTRWVTHAF